MRLTFTTVGEPGLLIMTVGLQPVLVAQVGGPAVIQPTTPQDHTIHKYELAVLALPAAGRLQIL